MSNRRTYNWRCQTSGRLHSGNSPLNQECDCQGPITDTALVTPRKKRQYTPELVQPDDELELDAPIHDSAINLPQAANEDMESVASLASADMTDGDHEENVDDVTDAENMAVVANARENTVANADENAVVVAHPSNEDVNPARQAIVNTPTDEPQIDRSASNTYDTIMLMFRRRFTPLSQNRSTTSDSSSITLVGPTMSSSSQDGITIEVVDPTQHVRRRRDAFIDERPNEQRLQERISLLHADRANQIQRTQHWKDAYLAKYHEAKRLALHGRICSIFCAALMAVVVLYVLWCYLNGPEMAYIQKKRAEAFFEV